MFHLLFLLANNLDTLYQFKMFASQKNIHHVSSPLTLSGLHMEDLTSTTFRPWVQSWGCVAPKLADLVTVGGCVGSARCLPGGVNVLDGNIYIYIYTYSPSRELNISISHQSGKAKLCSSIPWVGRWPYIYIWRLWTLFGNWLRSFFRVKLVFFGR